MKKIIKLLKRNPKKNQQRDVIPVYDICIVKKSMRRKFVYEKLGIYTQKGNHLSINIFRLTFWVSKNVCFTGNSIKLLLKFRVLNIENIND